jgi:hypothetical protein
MDWLQFIAAVIGHLAWPLVILILLIMVRKHIGALAERLLEFSFGGAKITFDKILEKGAEIIEHTPLPELPKLADEPELKLPVPPEVEYKKAGPRRTLNRAIRRRRKQASVSNQAALSKVVRTRRGRPASVRYRRQDGA